MSAHTDRTRFAHALHGVARELVLIFPASKWDSREGLELFHILGMSQFINWRNRPGINYVTPPHIAAQILMAASTVGTFSLGSFRAASIARITDYLTPLEQDRLVQYLLPVCLFLRGTLNKQNLQEILMKEADFSKIPKDVYDRLEASLASVEQSLAAQDPNMKLHLRESHSLLISYPETVALLRANEIATLIKAAEKHTQVEIIKAAASKKAGGKSGAKVTLDDI